MKASDGAQMTDRYLLDRLAIYHPWVKQLYEETSAFVHLSREAVAEGGIIDTYNHNGWQINHTIDDTIFRRLLERHRAQLVTRP